MSAVPPTPSAPLARPEDPRRGRRAVIAAALGNALEWFDIIVYAFMAPVIATLFFPDLEDPIGLIVTFGLFGVSYLIRPLGAMAIGHYGDRHGRKAALTLTIALMTLGVALMAFAPTYATIGAPRRCSSSSRDSSRGSRPAASSARRRRS